MKWVLISQKTPFFIVSAVKTSNLTIRNVSPVKYKLGSYIPDDGVLHSHGRENLSLQILPAINYLLSFPKYFLPRFSNVRINLNI
jgi:hypothetical protein